MLGEKLKELRESKGLLQQDVCEKLGVSQQSYSKWETGKAVPSNENLKKIAALFGVTVAYLYDIEPIIKVEKNKVSQLLDELFENGIIKGPEDIDGSVSEMILNAAKIDIRMKTIKQSNENK